jgi:hypothetical protein
VILCSLVCIPNLSYDEYRICFSGLKPSGLFVEHILTPLNTKVKKKVELYLFSFSDPLEPVVV